MLAEGIKAWAVMHPRHARPMVGYSAPQDVRGWAIYRTKADAMKVAAMTHPNCTVMAVRLLPWPISVRGK